jgi:hypothetical protein
VNTRPDHLVVAARDLDQGVAWAEATLGVVPAPGGKHALMGTHNRLVRLSGAGDAYLEIIAIAIDAAAPPPGRARWFGLDTDAVQQAIADAPKLVHVVARSENLDMHRFGLMAAGFDPGTTLAAQRETPHGLLRWRIVVPDDGVPRCRGALPTVIEWDGRHPCADLPECGVTLERIVLRGLPDAAAQVLRLRGIDLQPAPGPAVEAFVATPRGTVTLASPFDA